jgi:hypothetical protein
MSYLSIKETKEILEKALSRILEDYPILHRYSGEQLGRFYLKQTDFRGKNLNKVDLRKAELGGSILWNTDLLEANLEQADLERCDAQGANFYKARLYRANLYHADLRGAKFEQSELEEADCRFCNFQGVDAERSKWIKANLECAKLTYANLRGAKFNKANLLMADLSESVFNEHTDFTNAKIDCSTNFTDCIGLDKAKGLPQWVRDKYLPKSDVQDIVAQAFTESSADDRGEEGGETK